VSTDWAPDVAAILTVWFGGQEMADAMADVLFGDADPGGRLPTTFPVRLEHNPSYGNFPGENGQVRYGEGVLVGYRWYDTRALPTAFAFGHGLSYTTFDLAEPRLSAREIVAGDAITVDVDVTNTGRRRGTQVVQCYVSPPHSGVTRPEKELAAFAKVALEPGEQTTVTLTLDERAFAYWQPTSDEAPTGAPGPLDLVATPGPPPTPGWRVDPGTYSLLVGTSSTAVAHRAEITVVSP
jgi:beta-glucosidase